MEAYESLFGISHEFDLLKRGGLEPMSPGIAIETGHDGPIRSRTRKASGLGVTPGRTCHAAPLALTLAGFTNMMANRCLPSSIGILVWHLT